MSDRPVPNISKWSHLILWLVEKTWSAIAYFWQFVVRDFFCCNPSNLLCTLHLSQLSLSYEARDDGSLTSYQSTVYILFTSCISCCPLIHRWPTNTSCGFITQFTRALHRHREVTGSNLVKDHEILWLLYAIGKVEFITARIIASLEWL